MKKYLLLFILMKLLATSCCGQADTILYYNRYNIPCDAQSAKWYRQVHFTDYTTGKCQATEFYISGKIKRSTGAYVKHNYDMYLDGPSTGFVVQRWSNIFADGPFINYYENGNKESEGSFFCDSVQNKWEAKVGKWTEYYPDGRPHWVYNYSAGERDTLRRLVLNYWDSTGQQFILEGEGTCRYRALIHIPISATYADLFITSHYKNGLLEGQHLETFAGTGDTFCIEDYASGNLVKGVSYDMDRKAYNYTKLAEPPKYPGGNERLSKFIHKHIHYPEQERLSNIEGMMTVAFCVEKDGSVTDIKILHSITPAFDKETINVIRRLRKFEPATFKGQKIRSTCKQSENFKLI